MRSDSIGLFWQDLPVSRSRKDRVLGPMPPIPETGWQVPRDFPNLSRATLIGLDTETYDPHLLEKGPGWARRGTVRPKQPDGVPNYLHPVGAVIGVSVAVHDNAWYFPIRHTIHPETNLAPENVFAWLSDTLSTAQPKVGTNIIYDIGWLREEGVKVRGPYFDISYAEALLSETANLSLDDIAIKYLGTGKETNILYKWLSDWFGGEATGKQRKHMWQSPATLAGPYAEADALLPIRLMPLLWDQLAQQGLEELFVMECQLIPLLLDMRFRGVKVDLERAAFVDAQLTRELETAQEALNKLARTEVDVNLADSLALAFDNAGITYPLTNKTKRPSFTKPFLKTVEHPIAQHIEEVRKLTKLRDTFIRSYILDAHVEGRVYGQFHPMRGEEYGTRSGRFSSSNPNLQNIPSADKELAPMVRSIYVPDFGVWKRFDYAQIEYRLLLHFAVGPGADETRALYHRDPDTDYHGIIQDYLRDKANRSLDRKPVKNINFGLIYGMGEPTLARTLQLLIEEARALFKDYHAAVPYIKATMEDVSSWAQEHGYIQTILGRRSRFELWEPRAYNARGLALPLEACLRKHGADIQRAMLHKALNRKLQGSAADIIKKAMLICYQEDLFKGEFMPALTVHDELDFSAADPRDPHWRKIRHILETAIPLRIPVRADVEIGPNWGYLKKFE